MGEGDIRPFDIRSFGAGAAKFGRGHAHGRSADL
jgi:hypothetical protein